MNDTPIEPSVTQAELVEALARTQWMLENIDRSRSTNFGEVAERILANRKVLKDALSRPTTEPSERERVKTVGDIIRPFKGDE